MEHTAVKRLLLAATLLALLAPTNALAASNSNAVSLGSSAGNPSRVGSSPVHAGGGRACSSAPCFRRAIRWHEANERHLRRELAVRYTRDATYAIRLASAAFGISETDMRTIAQCESNLGAQKYAEAGSGASGLFQFLPSTFARTPFAGFDIFDAEANAMAAAWLVRKDGNWREWSCSSITGVR